MHVCFKIFLDNKSCPCEITYFGTHDAAVWSQLNPLITNSVGCALYIRTQRDDLICSVNK